MHLHSRKSQTRDNLSSRKLQENIYNY